MILLGGCATPYQSAGFTGGFSEIQLAPDVFRIVFRGNGFTDPQRAQDFAVLRAADLTLSRGFRYFGILGGADSVSQSSFTTPGEIYSSGYFNGSTYYGTSTYVPGQTFTSFKPESGLLIRCFSERPSNVPALDAQFLANSLRAAYKIRGGFSASGGFSAPPNIPPAARAAETRKVTLTNIATGEVCYGGFNLAQRQGWVRLPDGTRLAGNISGNSNATNSSAGTHGEGSAFLVSADSTKQMTIRVISNGLVTQGSGTGTMNDGRQFRITW